MSLTEQAAMQPPLVTCTGVGKTWQTDGAPFVALRDIDLDIARREFVVFLGPSGCGKSTLLYLMAGLEQAAESPIVCGGAPETGAGTDPRLVFLGTPLFSWGNVGEKGPLRLKNEHLA